MDAELHGWKGHVDVVDFASSRVLATAPNVRGEMAFNPSSTRLAAQSDQDLEILDIATGKNTWHIGSGRSIFGDNVTCFVGFNKRLKYFGIRLVTNGQKEAINIDFFLFPFVIDKNCPGYDLIASNFFHLVLKNHFNIRCI